MSDFQEVKNIIDELGKAVHEMRKNNDDRLTQLEKKGNVDPLLFEKVNKLSEAMVSLAETKDRLEKVETKLNRPPLGEEAKKAGSPERKAAYDKYFRHGDYDGLKALSVDGDPTGGYMVEETTSSQMITKLFETSPMRDVCTIETITGDYLEITEDINEVGGNWTSERGTVSETTTANTGMRKIPVHQMYAQPKASQQILDDAGIDIESWLAAKVSDKLGRLENLAFISGTGVGQPKGLTSYTTSLTPTNPSEILHVVSGHATQITADGLINMTYSLKSPYIAGASYLMQRKTVQVAALLKDTQNRYLWQPSLQAGTPEMLNGYPIKRMEDMTGPTSGVTFAAAALPIAFGDFKKAYTIVDRQGLRVLRDPFTAKPHVLFYTTKRTGGDVTNFEAFSLMKISV